MMKGYLDTDSNSTTTVTVAGLPASSGGYQVFVYADGDNGSATRTGIYTISGVGITTTTIDLTDAANTNFSGTFTQANNSAGNYVVFTINATGFTLSATGGTASDGFPRAPINGIQIVPINPTPNFALSATPSSQTVNPGGGTSYSVSTSALNGFTGSIALSVSGLPANATATFNPTSVSVGSSSTLTITTASNTPTGSFALTVTGKSGSLTNTTNVTLNVNPPPSFALSAAPSSQTVNPGGGTSYSVSTSAVNGFTGTISLSVSGLPANATGTFNPTSVSVGNSSTLTITTASNTPTGSYPLTITGTSGSVTNTTTVTLNVTAAASFTLSATPSSETVNPGGKTTYTVNTSATNGFTGSINLSVSGLPANTTGTFSPTSVTVGSSSTLTITTTSNTPMGSSTLTITGTSGSLTNTTTAVLNVTATSGSGNPISIDFVGEDVAMASTEVAGVVVEPNWNDATGVSSTSSLALLDSTGAATTATVSWNSAGIWETPITDQPGNARMMKGYLDTGSNTTTTVTVAGLPTHTAGYKVYVYADGDNGSASRTGIYTISGAGITTTTINLIDAANTNFSGTFIQANNSAGNYVAFTINATGFTLSASGGTASDGFPRAPVNGIQIVPQ
jgi:hypothetical protein